jgi:hypothetical protein
MTTALALVVVHSSCTVSVQIRSVFTAPSSVFRGVGAGGSSVMRWGRFVGWEVKFLVVVGYLVWVLDA